jgi:hypothetical protein
MCREYGNSLIALPEQPGRPERDQKWIMQGGMISSLPWNGL